MMVPKSINKDRKENQWRRFFKMYIFLKILKTKTFVRPRIDIGK